MKHAGKITFDRVRQVTAAYLVAVIVTYVTSSISQSLSVLAALVRAGAEIGPKDWLRTVVHDLYGFTFSGYVPQALVVMAGFVIAMPTAAIIHRFFKLPRWFLYPLAGATAMATILYIVKLNFYGSPLFPGTRGWSGFGLYLLTGALGGVVFSVLSKQRPWRCAESPETGAS